MKLSCLPVSYYSPIVNGSMTFDDWAREGKALGLDAVDVSVLFLKGADARKLSEMKQSLIHNKISIAAAAAYPDFTHPEKRVRKKELELFFEHLEALSFLGTEYVRVTAGQAHPEVAREDGIKWALEGITGSIDKAAELGITLLFENHAKPGVWTYADFAFPTDVFLEIAEVLRESQVKILFDTANPVAFGDEPLAILEKVIDRVECVHVSDTSVVGTLVPSQIGRGVVPIKEVFSMLKEYKYDGWMSIEEASGTGPEGFRIAVDFVRTSWNEIR